MKGTIATLALHRGTVFRSWAAAVALAMVASVLAVGPASAQAVVRIMPMGDSITAGFNVPGGYRTELARALLADGAAVDFVGSASSGPEALADKDHEGHNGFTISQARASVDGWLSVNPPDVVLLMIGTNDTKPENWQSASHAHAELGALVDQITSHASSPEVIVASIPPLADAARNASASEFNAGLPAIVGERAGNGVSFIDAGGALTLAQLSDGLHPTTEGHRRIGRAFRSALMHRFPAAPPPVPADHTILASDAFDRGTVNSLGSADRGGEWTRHGGPTWGVSANEARLLGGSGEGIVVLDAGTTDVEVSSLVRLSQGRSGPGFSLRAVNQRDQLLVGLTKRPGRDDVSLYRVRNGIQTQLARSSTLGLLPGATYRLRVRLDASQVRVFVDDVERLTVTLSPEDDSFFRQNSAFGLRAHADAEDGGSRWDQFRVTGSAPPPPPPPPPSSAPVARAGDDQVVEGRSAVVLDGSASSDADGRIVSYQWVQVSGPVVTLDSPAAPVTSFTAPPTARHPQQLTFSLRVTDDQGNTATDEVGITVPSSLPGYWMLDAGGTVHPFGSARHFGEPLRSTGAARPVDIESTASGRGYWTLDESGGVAAFGDAQVFGRVDPGRLRAGERITSMSATPSGNGYWLFSDRGAAFPFGDARSFGDLAGLTLNGPVVASVATATGRGYYMVGSDGGVFAFGDARFFGSMGGRRLNSPVRSLALDPDGSGYWLVAGDGGVFAFDAPFRGSMGGQPLNRPIVGQAASGDGYLLFGADGGVFDFSGGSFAGSLGGNPPAMPIVGAAVSPR